jgi:hypothetical protein
VLVAGSYTALLTRSSAGSGPSIARVVAQPMSWLLVLPWVLLLGLLLSCWWVRWVAEPRR